jgi:hypothetical protein
VNEIALIFLAVSAVALLAVPRRWAPLPLLAGASYMTLGQGVELGPLTFTVLRMLIAVGVIRVIVRRERLTGGMIGLDWLMAAWGAWAALSSAFHQDPFPALVTRLGSAYNLCGIYFLFRIFCSTAEDVVRLCRATALVLAPVALEMVYEQLTFHNLFSVFGGVPSEPHLREGRIRAFGPFAHPILAGSVGAASLPLMVGIWRYHRMAACVGILVCVTMVIGSASSGPALSAAFGIAALCMWPYRHQMRLFRWLVVCGYLVLELVMKVPPYYLIARISVVGGSTGWHRSRLIESALEHLGEWWLAGTDYTRHWMVEGIQTNENHVDITNYYLTIGVMGGLPLMLLLIGIMARAFAAVGRGAVDDSGPAERQFMFWSLGSSLAAHAATCISVSYFDQSSLFLYLTLAAIASARAAQILAVPEQSLQPSPSASREPGRFHGRRHVQPSTEPGPASSSRPAAWPSVPSAPSGTRRFGGWHSAKQR